MPSRSDASRRHFQRLLATGEGVRDLLSAVTRACSRWVRWAGRGITFLSGSAVELASAVAAVQAWRFTHEPMAGRGV